jgi:hypothetical protein
MPAVVTGKLELILIAATRRLAPASLSYPRPYLPSLTPRPYLLSLTPRPYLPSYSSAVSPHTYPTAVPPQFYSSTVSPHSYPSAVPPLDRTSPLTPRPYLYSFTLGCTSHSPLLSLGRNSPILPLVVLPLSYPSAVPHAPLLLNFLAPSTKMLSPHNSAISVYLIT